MKPFINKANLEIKTDLIEVELNYMLDCSAVHESEDVKSVTPASENLGKPGIDFGGTTDMADESHHNSVPSSTTEIDQKIVTTFPVEEKAGLPKDNLERSMGLEEEPYSPGRRPEAYTPPIYQTKVTHPTEEGK